MYLWSLFAPGPWASCEPGGIGTSLPLVKRWIMPAEFGASGAAVGIGRFHAEDAANGRSAVPYVRVPEAGGALVVGGAVGGGAVVVVVVDVLVALGGAVVVGAVVVGAVVGVALLKVAVSTVSTTS